MALALAAAPGADLPHATHAQRAVARYLLHRAGDPVDPTWLPADPAAQAAAARLAALPAAAQHDWLTTQLSAVRAGTLTIAELP